MNDAPKLCSAQPVQLDLAALPGYATVAPLLWYRTSLRPVLSLDYFLESVSYPCVLSLVNRCFVKSLFLFPKVASPARMTLVGPCPRGEGLRTDQGEAE